MSDKAPGYVDLTPVVQVTGTTTPSQADIAEPASDPKLAKTWLLQLADNIAHALATASGSDPVWSGLYLNEGETGYLRIRVPPGVTECMIRLRVAGSGSVTVTTSTDATGTTLSWDLGTTLDLESSAPISTVGVLPTSAGAASMRAVTVRAAVAWSWADEVLTIASSSSGSVNGVVYGIGVSPVHVARSATAGGY